MTNNRCQYKNCNKELSEVKRSDAKFCSRNCKSNNRKMKKYNNDKSKWVRLIDLTSDQVEKIKMIRQETTFGI